MNGLENWTPSYLNGMAQVGDPEMDRLVSRIVKLGQERSGDTSGDDPYCLVEETVRLLRSMKTNEEMCSRRCLTLASSKELAGILNEILDLGSRLPSWAATKSIRRSEQLFAESGILAGVLFFCSSLPEVYVASSISKLLRTTGHLEKATEHRIRSTATMILTILLPDGLTGPKGNGLVQIVKVRLIHSIVRQVLSTKVQLSGAAKDLRIPRRLTDALSSMRWNTQEDGQPCNQQAMAYTLLTFSYVYLRSLRRLELAYSPEDEEAYLHFWNVVGFVIGINEGLLAHTMEQAAALFEILQARVREPALDKENQRGLGRALVQTMEKSMSYRALKPVASLMMVFLSSKRTAADLALGRHHGPISRCCFQVAVAASRALDRIARAAHLGLSIHRLAIRIVGFHLLSKVLSGSNQALDLPSAIRAQVSAALGGWSHDPRSSAWVNELEDRLTTDGDWNGAIGV